MTIHTCGRNLSSLTSHFPLIINLRVWKDPYSHLVFITYVHAWLPGLISVSESWLPAVGGGGFVPRWAFMYSRFLILGFLDKRPDEVAVSGLVWGLCISSVQSLSWQTVNGTFLHSPRTGCLLSRSLPYTLDEMCGASVLAFIPTCSVYASPHWMRI